jgi:deoxyadenosine/deoxycytidine kinase
LDANRYIVVEGLPGAGKSVLARALSQAVHGRLVEDPAGANPFWDSYQKDPQAHGFSLQVFSLLQRFRQQQGLVQGDLFGAGMVADYLFERDRLFAHLILGEAELGLYEQLYKLLARESVPRPDLVVYLQAATEVLQRRSRGAGRAMAPEALEALGKSYNQYFFHYNASALLVVNTNDLDLRAAGQDLGELVERALSTHAGTQYYTPKR